MQFNPYPGLRPFEFEESDLFYGREGQAEEVLRRLQKSRFVAVVGTSGSGKSSLVRAGLLPLLYGGLMVNTGSLWRMAILRPGNNPIHNLARALVYPPEFAADPFAENDNPLELSHEMKVEVVETILRRSAVGLLDYVQGGSFESDENLLIVVDQFEELFRYKQRGVAGDTLEAQTSEAEDKTAFVKLLLEAVHSQTLCNVYVVITMRSDYLGDCAEFRDLPETINDGQYLIPRLSRDQLRQVIESPAKVHGVEMSPALVTNLLNAIGDDQDQLPVLQHSLMRTWNKWAKRENQNSKITYQDYESRNNTR